MSWKTLVRLATFPPPVHPPGGVQPCPVVPPARVAADGDGGETWLFHSDTTPAAPRKFCDVCRRVNDGEVTARPSKIAWYSGTRNSLLPVGTQNGSCPIGEVMSPMPVGDPSPS